MSCHRSEEHPSVEWERGARRLQQVLIARAFRELVLAREQRRADYQRWGLPAPEDDAELRALLGR